MEFDLENKESEKARKRERERERERELIIRKRKIPGNYNHFDHVMP